MTLDKLVFNLKDNIGNNIEISVETKMYFERGRLQPHKVKAVVNVLNSEIDHYLQYDSQFAFFKDCPDGLKVVLSFEEEKKFMEELNRVYSYLSKAGYIRIAPIEEL